MCITSPPPTTGRTPHRCDLLPQLRFRNTWRWGATTAVPVLRQVTPPDAGDGWSRRGRGRARVPRPLPPVRRRVARARSSATTRPTRSPCGAPTRNATAYPKDGVEPGGSCTATRRWSTRIATGTKAALRTTWMPWRAGETVTIRLRLSAELPGPSTRSGRGFDAVLADRQAEADDFYAAVLPERMTDEDRRSPGAPTPGCCGASQLYRYDVGQWLRATPPARRRHRSGARPSPPAGTPAGATSTSPTSSPCPTSGSTRGSPPGTSPSTASPSPTSTRPSPRSSSSSCAASGPCIPTGSSRPTSGPSATSTPRCTPGPPGRSTVLDGARDRDFLVRVFSKLLHQLRVVGQPQGRRRVEPVRGRVPRDGQHRAVRPLEAPCPRVAARAVRRDELDGLLLPAMLRIALELARARHRVGRPRDEVPRALPRHRPGDRGPSAREKVSLWDEEDGFFYDVLVGPDGAAEPVRVRSIVGLLPLLGVATAAGVGRRRTCRTSPSGCAGCSAAARAGWARSLSHPTPTARTPAHDPARTRGP